MKGDAVTTLEAAQLADTKVPAAARTVAVLQALAKAGAPITATALAAKVGVPRSSIYQLLEVLEGSGFVIHFADQSRWGLGVAAFELGSAYLRHDPLERLARPILLRLARQTEREIDAVAQLGILHGAETLYLLKELPSHPITVVSEVGVRLPAHLTASGRALLAQLPATQVRAIYGKTAELVNRTGLGPKTARELTAILATESKLGFAFEQGHVTEGYSSLAAAAKNHLGIPVAAFALTFRTEDAPEPTRLAMAQKVVAAALELSKRLGAK
jgi:DNA-binding IclR family transcriptional regulator